MWPRLWARLRGRGDGCRRRRGNGRRHLGDALGRRRRGAVRPIAAARSEKTSGGEGNREADGDKRDGGVPPRPGSVSLLGSRRGARHRPSSSGAFGRLGCDRLGGEQLMDGARQPGHRFQPRRRRQHPVVPGMGLGSRSDIDLRYNWLLAA